MLLPINDKTFTKILSITSNFLERYHFKVISAPLTYIISWLMILWMSCRETLIKENMMNLRLSDLFVCRLDHAAGHVCLHFTLWSLEPTIKIFQRLFWQVMFLHCFPCPLRVWININNTPVSLSRLVWKQPPLIPMRFLRGANAGSQSHKSKL